MTDQLAIGPTRIATRHPVGAGLGVLLTVAVAVLLAGTTAAAVAVLLIPLVWLAGLAAVVALPFAAVAAVGHVLAR